MVLKRLKILFCLLCFALSGIAQDNQQGVFEENSVLYRRQALGGVVANTDGVGLFYSWGKHIDGYKRRLYTVEITNIKHPKEKRVYNPFYQDGRGYIFGKNNYVLALRGSWGQKKKLHDKVRDNGVQVSRFYAIGATLALLKPVYFEIGKNDNDTTGSPIPYEYLEEEKFDLSKHNVENIFGRAPFSSGLDEITIAPGINAKAGLNFEYDPNREGIKALEIGVAADVFFKPLDIMEVKKNKQVYLRFYVNFQLGKRFTD